MKRPRFLRDPLHLQLRFDAYDVCIPPDELRGDARLSWASQRCLDSAPLQRLRGIRQNGLANLVFHGSEHSRFSHSLGVFHLARVMYERICRNTENPEDPDHKLQTCLAALVHDVGHGPFSHTLEEILKNADIKFHHETMTRRFITEEDSEICRYLMEIDNSLPAEVDRFFEKRKEEDEHWRYRVVSSQMDADRLDYVQRDAMFAGIRGHGFDLERLLDLLYVHDEKCLAVHRGAIESVEAYLVTLDHLWRSIYYHHAVRAATVMFGGLFARATSLYKNGDKSVFSSRGDRQHPIIDLFERGSQIDLERYLRLSDVSFWELVEYWRDYDDKVLADLANRIVNRKLLKTVEFDPIEIEKYEAAKTIGEDETAKILGGKDNVEYYFYRDSPDRTSYKKYDWKPESQMESIWLVKQGDRDVPIEEEGESHLVTALKQKKTFNRWVAFPEVRDKISEFLSGS